MRYQIRGLIKRCGGFIATTMTLAVLVVAGCGGGGDGGSSTDGGSTTTGGTNTGGTTTGGTNTGGTNTGGTTTGGTTTGGTTTGGTTTGATRLPRTSQIITYAAGDDGDLQMGVPWPDPRFIDIGDGTVADKLTGLIWAKDTSTPTVNACVGGNKTWQEALDYIACLNRVGYLGHNDWLLPNANEFMSIFDSQFNDPALRTVFPFTGGYVGDWGYVGGWSSTTYAERLDSAWPGGLKSNKNSVSPVRRGKWSSAAIALPRTGQTTSYASGDDGALQRGVADPVPRFTSNGDGTVTDNRTGLIWLKNASCFSPKFWAGALTSANTLASGSCGLSDGSVAGDWRLPNVVELSSLVDYRRSNPALPQGHPFIGVRINDLYWYWTSSNSYNEVGGLFVNYCVDLLDGGLGDTTDELEYVWPVRGGQFSPL